MPRGDRLARQWRLSSSSSAGCRGVPAGRVGPVDPRCQRDDLRPRAIPAPPGQEELEAAPPELRREILEEIRGIEFELVAENMDSAGLFAAYLEARIVPPRYRNDLRHVAVATVARVDALVSWNFRHLVNLRTRRVVHAVNLRLGHPLLEIVSPEEV